MKKSSAIRLVLLGGSSLALGACDQGPPTDAKVYSSLQECTAYYSEAQCQDKIAKVEEAHAKEAPRFTRKEECETQFGAGQCESRESASGGGSFFMPLLMGYMLGNAFNRPVYRGADGGAFMRQGSRDYKVGSFAGAGKSASFQPAAITQVSRGGLGSTASAMRSSSGS